MSGKSSGSENKTEKKVKIRINSERWELDDDTLQRYIEGYLAQYNDEEGFGITTEDSEKTEMVMEGVLSESDGRISLIYDESELTGMQGSKTVLTFRKNADGLITMMRSGTVRTALVFEENVRHICTYNVDMLPPFEVCVHTLCLRNKIEESGTLYVDYIIEIQGTRAGRSKLLVTVSDLCEIPDFD